MSKRTLTKEEIAHRIALDIPEGAYVNLGIGIPGLVAGYLPPDREVILHSENGILGLGPPAPPGQGDPDIVDAGKTMVTLITGAAIVDHATSFAVIRGGHLDIAVLGAYQVSSGGDIANWRVPGESVPSVGGAMDLCAGAKQVWVAMTHTTGKGEPKIVAQCTYPITARGRVTRIFTDLALIDVADGVLYLRELAPGWTVDEVQARTDVLLHTRGPVPELALREGGPAR